jgi:SAM-dependent methyltransferase
MDLTDFYRGGYVDGTYGDRMKENFKRILALPENQSDNSARVKRVLDFAKRNLEGQNAPNLLDVGSGLAVFPFRMKEAGWQVTALDPDVRAAVHAREQAGVKAIHADFLEYEPGEAGQFNIISMNKVLEHVESPVAMLARALRWIQSGGVAYLEVPDASAERLGPGREEFFIEHLHVFSPESLRLVIEKSGWTLLKITPLREASGKFTLAGFAKNK